QLLLGSCMVNRESASRVRGYLKPQHFYEPVHARIYDALSHVNGRMVDEILLKPAFENDESLKELGGGKYLSSLADMGSTTMPEDADNLARNIVELYARRGLIALAGEAANRAYDLSISESVTDQAARIRQYLDSLALETPEREPPPHIDLSRLNEPVPDRRFIIDQWIPVGHLTSIYGEGSSGKSFLSMLLGTCLAYGLSWIGTPASQCTVLGFFCEDNDEELLIRQNTILKGLRLNWRDVASRLFLVDRVGANNTMMTFEQGAPVEGPAMRDLQAKIKEVNPRVVILDNIGHLYGGNENDRFQVTCFLNRMAGLAREIDGSIVILGHPPKSAAEYSGSTAWSNNVRSRLWLEKCKDDDDRWILKRSKTNYADPCELFLVRDQSTGLVRPDEPQYESEAARHEADLKLEVARQHIKDTVDVLNGRDQNTSHSKNASNYLLKIMDIEGMSVGFKRGVLERALKSLMDLGSVTYEVVGKHPKGSPIKSLVRPSNLV
ncbi:MAG: AAA family ATPase, partial [Gammaproteobacteria bacterium]